MNGWNGKYSEWPYIVVQSMLVGLNKKSCIRPQLFMPRTRREMERYRADKQNIQMKWCQTKVPHTWCARWSKRHHISARLGHIQDVLSKIKTSPRECRIQDRLNGRSITFNRCILHATEIHLPKFHSRAPQNQTHLVSAYQQHLIVEQHLISFIWFSHI